MESIIIALITAAGTIAASNGYWNYKIELAKEKAEEKAKAESEDSATSRMVLGLGHDRVLALTDKYIFRGGITMKEKRNLKYLYPPYKEMGGNGDCELGYAECLKLPIITEEEARERDGKNKRRLYHLESEDD